MSTSPIRRETTVADVAAVAKVSKAQAARALGGYGAVSSDVRSRVLKVAEQLGYHPNMLARSMNTGRSHTIGVVVGDIQNPYFSLAMRAISDTAQPAGYDVLLINTGEDVKAEQEAVRVLQDKRVDGYIIAPVLSDDNAHLRAVVDSGRPLVLLDRAVDGLEVDVIATASEQASFEAAQLLLEQGHERIAYISTLKARSDRYGSEKTLGSTPVAQRLGGMRRAFKEAGKEFPASLVRLNAGTDESIHEIVQELLAPPFGATAIMASDSVIALSALEEIANAGLTIPADLSFVMFDDLPWTRLLTPPLTVVSQPVYELGVAVATTLIHRMRGEQFSAEFDFHAQLIRRGSVAAPPHAETIIKRNSVSV
ncbi:LacI family DNA-binding transcriptional regulator [Arthrobacter sp. EH-1B-1]|uniref:LacI family DNA-binding transcriptional regulator n=1 Tax=Arthrobacter vasquezii TaxID=2977629 RepID=A0ABT6CV87_9MICC|nr:LacI family DNA-binding transcriptional regulator [Arthrobacter vasquezii]MDF9277407.1 LacI family DNA-binding transcriptional regulator [Arthrobacter vasquezii]